MQQGQGKQGAGQPMPAMNEPQPPAPQQLQQVLQQMQGQRPPQPQQPIRNPDDMMYDPYADPDNPYRRYA